MEISDLTESIIQKLSQKAIDPRVDDLAKELGISLGEMNSQLALLANYEVAKFHHTPHKNTVQRLSKFSEVLLAGGLRNYLSIKKSQLISDKLEFRVTGGDVEIRKGTDGLNLVLEHISNGRLEDAIQELKTLSLIGEERGIVIQLSSRYKLLKQKKLQGTITHENQRIDENQISTDLLELVSRIESKTNNLT